MNTVSMGDALFTKTQQRVIGILFVNPERSFYLNEINRIAGVGKGSVKRELDKLCAAGILVMSKQGNQNHYKANADCPIFSELKSIAQKTFGIVDVVKNALTLLLPKIEMAFIYGSIAKGSENSQSDIDIMIVSNELSYGEVLDALSDTEGLLSRVINPTMYSVEEFSQRVTNNQSFIKRVMEQPKLWIKGNIE